MASRMYVSSQHMFNVYGQIDLAVWTYNKNITNTNL